MLKPHGLATVRQRADREQRANFAKDFAAKRTNKFGHLARCHAKEPDGESVCAPSGFFANALSISLHELALFLALLIRYFVSLAG
jgi:hypothetical protein